MIAVRRILVPVTFDSRSPRVLEIGRMLADGCGASLHLLHVIAPPVAAEGTLRQQEREVCSRLEALLDQADRERRRPTTACGVGTPASEIVRYARANAIDIIVMGTHSHGPAFQMATGSIAECVLGLAPCAVLAVKGEDTRPYETAPAQLAAATRP